MAAKDTIAILLRVSKESGRDRGMALGHRKAVSNSVEEKISKINQTKVYFSLTLAQLCSKWQQAVVLNCPFL